MKLVVPVDNSQGNYTLKLALEGAVYGLNVRWNQRMLKWILDILDSTGNAVLLGLPILEEQALTDRFVGRLLGLPPGQFVAIDGTGAQLDPTDVTFGSAVQLIYVES
jgi:hypothetical protein